MFMMIRIMSFSPETTGQSAPSSAQPGRKALGPRYIEFHPTLPIAYVARALAYCRTWWPRTPPRK